MPAATVSAKGQVTVPKAVRAALGVCPGDRVEFVQMPDGHIAIMPATVSIMSLEGSLRHEGSPVSLEDMDAAVAAAAAEP